LAFAVAYMREHCLSGCTNQSTESYKQKYFKEILYRPFTLGDFKCFIMRGIKQQIPPLAYISRLKLLQQISNNKIFLS
jgi:hypothetical protein